MMDETLKKFDIDKKYIMQTVSDGEAAVQKAFRALLLDQVPYVPHYTCMIHVIQTIIRHSFNFHPVLYKKDGFKAGHAFFQKVKSLISFFKKSPKRERRLKEYSKSKLKINVGLLQVNVTRWNSVYLAFKRLVMLRKAIEAVIQFDYDKKKKLLLTKPEWKSLEQVVGIMRRAASITKLLQFRKISITAFRHIFCWGLTSISKKKFKRFSILL